MWKRRERHEVISGVYVLFSEKHLLYVGQSKNIHQRVKSHKHIPWTYYKYIEIDDAEEKACKESSLMEEFKPVYNTLTRKAILPNQVNSHQHSLFTGKNKEKRWKAEAAIISKYRNQVGSISSRKMQRLLWHEYLIVINHNTINNDLKTKKYTPYLKNCSN